MNKNSPNKENELLMEQYKLYVEMTDRLSARRNDSSKFYTSLLTALLAFSSIIVSQNFPMLAQKIVFFAIGVLGFTLCIVWVLNINSYKQLASLKYKVIHELEQELPFQCYKREWDILNANQQKYRRLSKVESFVPILFGLLFLTVILISIVAFLSP